jgi:hypothetical protein
LDPAQAETEANAMLTQHPKPQGHLRQGYDASEHTRPPKDVLDALGQ